MARPGRVYLPVQTGWNLQCNNQVCTHPAAKPKIFLLSSHVVGLAGGALLAVDLHIGLRRARGKDGAALHGCNQSHKFEVRSVRYRRHGARGVAAPHGNTPRTGACQAAATHSATQHTSQYF